jgi:hypothetical protein
MGILFSLNMYYLLQEKNLLFVFEQTTPNEPAKQIRDIMLGSRSSDNPARTK